MNKNKTNAGTACPDSADEAKPRLNRGIFLGNLVLFLFKSTTMIFRLLFILLLFAGSYVDNRHIQTSVEERYSNRLYFRIDSTTQHIIVPVQVNDTAVARLVFDTDHWPEMIFDSSFFFSHRSMDSIPFTTLMHSLPIMQQFNIKSFRYETTHPFKIGQTPVDFHRIDVMPVKILDENIDGFFNIPKKDSTHVWELNFKESYIEVHAADTFHMPERCIVLPVLEQPDAYAPGYCIKMPLQLIFGEDTLASDYLYRMDTGMTYEFLLSYPGEEITCLYSHPDNTWYAGNSSDNKRGLNMAKAKAWNHFEIDTLAVSSMMNDYIASYRYIGLPFLRRFNVFFDMKNRQVGLQPVRHTYSRNVLTGLYFCVDTTLTEEGAYRINFMKGAKDNYYQAAGLSLYDEIVSVNNVSYEEIVQRRVRAGDLIAQSDTLVFDIFQRRAHAGSSTDTGRQTS